MATRVSIIIPCFNNGTYLSESLNSVIYQTFNDWEVIIVDDGSIDNTKEISESFGKKDKRIKYIPQKHSGVAAARNNGVKNAIGEYILQLDADDYISETYLEKAVCFLDNNPEYSVCSCKAEYFGGRNGLVELSYKGYAHLLICNDIHICSMLRKKDWDRIGGYDETFRKGLEDWEFWIRLLYHNEQFYVIPEVLWFYRAINDKETVTSIAHKNRHDVENEILKKNFDIYAEYHNGIINIMTKYYNLKEWSERRLPRFLRWSMCNLQKILGR